MAHSVSRREKRERRERRKRVTFVTKFFTFLALALSRICEVSLVDRTLGEVRQDLDNWWDKCCGKVSAGTAT